MTKTPPQAQVSIPLEQLDALRAELKEAHNESAALRAQLADAKSHDPSGRVGDLTTLVREMLVIVRFAVANLPPSEIRGWPWRHVRSIASRLATMPDFTQDDDVLVTELGIFADEIVEHDNLRARQREDRLVAESVSAALERTPRAPQRSWWQKLLGRA